LQLPPVLLGLLPNGWIIGFQEKRALFYIFDRLDWIKCVLSVTNPGKNEPFRAKPPDTKDNVYNTE
jgi:hypothetical protein